MTPPHFRIETSFLLQGLPRILGVDEAGRGPLAGPVTAAAVRLDPDRIPEGLADSKLLSRRKREALDALIRDVAEVTVAHASVAEITALNIRGASDLAMRRAVAQFGAADYALVDGKLLPRDLGVAASAIIGGDGKCLSIAAASIVAKVARDRIMADLHRDHPDYGWDRNAGYPTPEHLRALKTWGVTPHHRVTFRPVHQILYQDLAITP